jgi:hypothetical protein
MLRFGYDIASTVRSTDFLLIRRRESPRRKKAHWNGNKNIMNMRPTSHGSAHALSHNTTSLFLSLMVGCKIFGEIAAYFFGPFVHILADVTSVGSCMNEFPFYWIYASRYLYVCCDLHDALPFNMNKFTCISLNFFCNSYLGCHMNVRDLHSYSYVHTCILNVHLWMITWLGSALWPRRNTISLSLC